MKNLKALFDIFTFSSAGRRALEERMQKILDKICKKTGSDRIKVMIFFDHGKIQPLFMHIETNKIFFREQFARMLTCSEIEWCFAHEIAHKLKKTRNEFLCDKFAAEHTHYIYGLSVFSKLKRFLHPLMPSEKSFLDARMENLLKSRK